MKEELSQILSPLFVDEIILHAVSGGALDDPYGQGFSALTAEVRFQANRGQSEYSKNQKVSFRCGSLIVTGAIISTQKAAGTVVCKVQVTGVKHVIHQEPKVVYKNHT